MVQVAVAPPSGPSAHKASIGGRGQGLCWHRHHRTLLVGRCISPCHAHTHTHTHPAFVLQQNYFQWTSLHSWLNFTWYWRVTGAKKYYESTLFNGFRDFCFYVFSYLSRANRSPGGSSTISCSPSLCLSLWTVPHTNPLWLWHVIKRE